MRSSLHRSRTAGATVRGLAGSPAARPLRFLFVGGLTFVVQIGLLMLFTQLGLPSLVAYALALGLAVQFNFVVNQLTVWQDRPIASGWRAVAGRWASFHAWISISLVVNMAAFAVAHLFMPDVLAAIVAVAASTAFKFLSLDRFAFRQAPSR
jgi:putative flippase GtrA